MTNFTKGRQIQYIFHKVGIIHEVSKKPDKWYQDPAYRAEDEVISLDYFRNPNNPYVALEAAQIEVLAAYKQNSRKKDITYNHFRVIIEGLQDGVPMTNLCIQTGFTMKQARRSGTESKRYSAHERTIL